MRQSPHTSRGIHILFISSAETLLLFVSEGERSQVGQVGLFRRGMGWGHFQPLLLRRCHRTTDIDMEELKVIKDYLTIKRLVYST